MISRIINHIKECCCRNKQFDKEDRLKIFFDAAFEGIAITKDAHFIDGNDRFFDMFGYKKSEMIGMPVMKLVHEEDQELVKKRMLGGYSKPYEHRCIHRDGSLCFVEVHGKNIKHKGEVLRLTAIHDITHIKKAQEDRIKLRYHQNQISKLEAIGSFAGGIVHDFNNVLAPIIGNCELILYDIQDDLDRCKVHRRNITAILQAAEMAKLLVNRIQAFAKGEKEAPLEPLNISDSIKEAFGFLRSIIPKETEMKLNVNTTVEMVMANDLTIKQILMNLCKNSLQSMDVNRKGRILIKINSKNFKEKQFEIPKGKYIKIEIEDNGKGMSSKIMEKAFDPYFTTKVEGTGIGLSVVARLIKNYNGFIRLKSAIGEGTTVIIYIPIIS